MDTQIDGKEYRTSDIHYAAFLRVAKVPFLRVSREEGRSFFYFEDTGNMKDLREGYYNRTAKVVARDFAEETRAVKTLMHMDQDSGR